MNGRRSSARWPRVTEGQRPLPRRQPARPSGAARGRVPHGRPTGAGARSRVGAGADGRRPRRGRPLDHDRGRVRRVADWDLFVLPSRQDRSRSSSSRHGCRARGRRHPRRRDPEQVAPGTGILVPPEDVKRSSARRSWTWSGTRGARPTRRRAASTSHGKLSLERQAALMDEAYGLARPSPVRRLNGPALYIPRMRQGQAAVVVALLVGPMALAFFSGGSSRPLGSGLVRSRGPASPWRRSCRRPWPRLRAGLAGPRRTRRPRPPGPERPSPGLRCGT